MSWENDLQWILINIKQSKMNQTIQYKRINHLVKNICRQFIQHPWFKRNQLAVTCIEYACRAITLRVYKHIKGYSCCFSQNGYVIQIVFTIDENGEITQTTPIVCHRSYISLLKCLNWISQWFAIIEYSAAMQTLKQLNHSNSFTNLINNQKSKKIKKLNKGSRNSTPRASLISKSTLNDDTINQLINRFKMIFEFLKDCYDILNVLCLGLRIISDAVPLKFDFEINDSNDRIEPPVSVKQENKQTDKLVLRTKRCHNEITNENQPSDPSYQYKLQPLAKKVKLTKTKQQIKNKPKLLQCKSNNNNKHINQLNEE